MHKIVFATSVKKTQKYFGLCCKSSERKKKIRDIKLHYEIEEENEKLTTNHIDFRGESELECQVHEKTSKFILQ